jgi:hypothetical protein
LRFSQMQASQRQPQIPHCVRDDSRFRVYSRATGCGASAET